MTDILRRLDNGMAVLDISTFYTQNKQAQEEVAACLKQGIVITPSRREFIVFLSV